MAFGDVLAGLAEASYKHGQNLLQMDYHKKSELSEMYGKLAQDPNYPAEARQEFLNRAVQIHTLQPGKKLPKEWESMQITIQPPRGPNVEQPQAPSTGAAGLPLENVLPDIQAPLPPPRTQSVMAPLSFEDRLAQQLQTAQAAGGISAETAGKTKAAELGAENAPANVDARVREARERMAVPVPPSLQGTLGPTTMPQTLAAQVDLATHNIPNAPLPSADMQEYNAYVDQAKAARQKFMTIPEWLKFKANLRPPDPSLALLRGINLENLTKAAPGQLVYKSTGNPVPTEKVGDAASTRLGQFKTAVQQLPVVQAALKKIGDTGAIKG